MQRIAPFLLSFLLSLLALTANAEAQTPPLAPLRSAVLPVEGAALRTELGLSFSYAYRDHEHDGTLLGDDLSLEIPSSVTIFKRNIPKHALALVLSARVALWRRLEVSASLPIVATRAMAGHGGPGGIGGHGLGNLQGQLKVAILQNTWGILSLSAYMGGSFPTFQSFDDNELSPDYWTLRPGIAMDLRAGKRLTVSFDAAVFWHSTDGPQVPRSPDPNQPLAGGDQSSTTLLLGVNAGLRVHPALTLLAALQFSAGALAMDDAFSNLRYVRESQPTGLTFSGGLRVQPAGFLCRGSGEACKRRLYLELGVRVGRQQVYHGGDTVAGHAALGYAFDAGLF